MPYVDATSSGPMIRLDYPKLKRNAEKVLGYGFWVQGLGSASLEFVLIRIRRLTARFEQCLLQPYMGVSENKGYLILRSL